MSKKYSNYELHHVITLYEEVFFIYGILAYTMINIGIFQIEISMYFQFIFYYQTKWDMICQNESMSEY